MIRKIDDLQIEIEELLVNEIHDRQDLYKLLIKDFFAFGIVENKVKEEDKFYSFSIYFENKGTLFVEYLKMPFHSEEIFVANVFILD